MRRPESQVNAARSDVEPNWVSCYNLQAIPIARTERTPPGQHRTQGIPSGSSERGGPSPIGTWRAPHRLSLTVRPGRLRGIMAAWSLDQLESPTSLASASATCGRGERPTTATSPRTS
jgi:hypothetical protein